MSPHPRDLLRPGLLASSSSWAPRSPRPGFIPRLDRLCFLPEEPRAAPGPQEPHRVWVTLSGRPDQASHFCKGNSGQDGPCDHSVTVWLTGAESQMHPERTGASRELGRPRGRATSGTRGCQSPKADWPTCPFVLSSESLPLNPTSTPGTYQPRERNRALKEYVRKYWSVPEPPTGRAQVDTGHTAVGP